MPTPGHYGRAYVYVDGALQVQCDSVTLEGQGDPILVSTMTLDFAGTFSPPKSGMLSFESFVPEQGMELDVFKAFIRDTQFTFKFQLGGSGAWCEGVGVFMAPSITASPTNPTKLTAKAMVQLNEFSSLGL